LKIRHFIIGLAGALFALSARATDIGLVGVFPGKAAVLVIDGGAPTAVRIGRTRQGVTVISAGEGQAVVEVGGKRQTIRLGVYSSSASRDTRQKVTIAADLAGHFYANGQVNGGPVRFLVDTGATTVALPADIADRLGIDDMHFVAAQHDRAFLFCYPQYTLPDRSDPYTAFYRPADPLPDQGDDGR